MVMNWSDTDWENSWKGLLPILSFTTEAQLGHCSRNTETEGKATLHDHLRTETAHLSRIVAS